MAKVEIKVPEEVSALLRKEPLLRTAIEEVVKKEIMEYLTTILTLNNLTEDSKLTEEDIMRINTLIKRGIRKKWDLKNTYAR